jgi:hypothetical protein
MHWKLTLVCASGSHGDIMFPTCCVFRAQYCAVMHLLLNAMPWQWHTAAYKSLSARYSPMHAPDSAVAKQSSQTMKKLHRLKGHVDSSNQELHVMCGQCMH